METTTDIAERVRSLLERARTVGDGGPWVRLRPAASTEATTATGAPPAGALNGIVMAVKDLVAVEGLPMGAGSLTRGDAAAEARDAAVVARLRQAGAVVAGTVALHELAFGVTGVNDQVGFPPHPDDPDRIPGGSSSGSAVAVALHDCDLAIGTDTGGSVRIPAALCGVVGFKPSRHRYPLDGVLPLAPALDHVGLLAGEVGTIVAAHQALTGETVVPTLPRRIGLDRAGLERATEPVATAIDAALRALADAGCDLVEMTTPDWPAPELTVEVSTTILIAEAARTHRDLLDGPARQLLGPDVAARLDAGAAVTDGELEAARKEQERIEATVRVTLATFDVVAGPTVPVLAPLIADARRDPSLSRTLVTNTRLANLTGVPAVTLPIAGADLPIGFQLVAASDDRTLGYAAAVSRTFRGNGPP